jgi:hypothetical protein
MTPVSCMVSRGDDAVELVDPAAVPDWDERVLQFPEGSVFHSRGWMEVLHQTYGYRPSYLVSRRHNEWRGIFPIAEVRSLLTGPRGVALPFSDFCPPLATEPAALDSLWEAAFGLGMQRGWRYLDSRGGQSPDSAPSSITHYAHILDLTPSPNDLFAGFKPTLRTAIRKAQKAEIPVETSRSLESIREFFRLQVVTRRRQGLPPQPASFFDRLHECVIAKGDGEVVLARHEGRAIAGAVFLWLGNRAVFKFGASDPRWLASRSNNLVMWVGIQSCRSRGIQSLHLGRTSFHNTGLRRFKLAWGPAEMPLAYHRRDCLTRGWLEVREDVAGWQQRLFSMLPTPVLRAVGSMAYRHIG